jgi:hypothetical protein
MQPAPERSAESEARVSCAQNTNLMAYMTTPREKQ